jgi:hypothetical protein
MHEALTALRNDLAAHIAQNNQEFGQYKALVSALSSMIPGMAAAPEVRAILDSSTTGMAMPMAAMPAPSTDSLTTAGGSTMSDGTAAMMTAAMMKEGNPAGALGAGGLGGGVLGGITNTRVN